MGTFLANNGLIILFMIGGLMGSGWILVKAAAGGGTMTNGMFTISFPRPILNIDKNIFD